MNRIYIFLLALAATCGLVSLYSATATAEPQEFKYENSLLSSDGVEVNKLISGHLLAGCAVMDNNAKPELFLMRLRDGSGTIALVGPHYKINTSRRVVSIKIKIGTRFVQKYGVIDGNAVNISLSVEDLSNLIRHNSTINGIKIDSDSLRAINDLAMKCISS